MHRQNWRVYCGFLLAAECLAQSAGAPHAITWQEARDRFRANNPALLAGQVAVEEARAEEITAYLRPNPDFTLATDGTQIASSQGVWQPFAGTMVSTSLSYLHERQQKRELRLESAQKATAVATSAQTDLERNLIFNLRDAFVRVLLAKAVAGIAKENLDYYDKSLSINRDRYSAGAIAHVDLQRLDLQRVQFVSDLATAQVNLRTAKIDLEALLRDGTPVDQFDVTERFDYAEPVVTLDELRSDALSNRPDLQEARQTLEKAKADHQLAVANGSTDPTFSGWWTHNGSSNNPNAFNTLGASISIPLRLFDRNQGEKLRTQLDIGRSEKLRDASEITALHDVDSAYATLRNTLELLRPYRSQYLQEANDIRSTISFSYEHGSASLLEFLDAQKEYRATQLSYVNLIGAYLSAVNQLNFAVGQEVIP